MTRLAYRLLAIVTRRARESSTIELETETDGRDYALSLSGAAYEPDWSEAALLDLRISTLVAALHEGELEVGADASRPCVLLRLPTDSPPNSSPPNSSSVRHQFRHARYARRLLRCCVFTRRRHGRQHP